MIVLFDTGITNNILKKDESSINFQNVLRKYTGENINFVSNPVMLLEVLGFKLETIISDEDWFVLEEIIKVKSLLLEEVLLKTEEFIRSKLTLEKISNKYKVEAKFKKDLSKKLLEFHYQNFQNNPDYFYFEVTHVLVQLVKVKNEEFITKLTVDIIKKFANLDDFKILPIRLLHEIEKKKVLSRFSQLLDYSIALYLLTGFQGKQVTVFSTDKNEKSWHKYIVDTFKCIQHINKSIENGMEIEIVLGTLILINRDGSVAKTLNMESFLDLKSKHKES